MVETRVARKKRRIPLLAQENDNLLVPEALAADVNANLFRPQPRCFEQQALPVENVLVENDQA